MFKQPNVRLFVSTFGKSKHLYRLHCLQQGATSIEYALITALIGLFVAGAIGTTGSSLSTLWNQNLVLITDAIEMALGK